MLPATVLDTSTANRVYGRAAVRWAVQRGRWQRPHPGAVVTHNGPLTRRERMHVAALGGPPGTLLAGLSAAELGGLTGFGVDRVFVVIPPKARSPRLTGVTVHRTRTDLGEGIGDPPRTGMERSIIDAAIWATSPRLARAIVLAGIQQRVTTADRMADAVGARGRVRHISLVRETILDAGGGIESLPERDFAVLLRRAGLPRPAAQHPLRTPSGRYRLDAYFARWDLVVEIDGAHHRDVRQSSYDLVRQNQLVVDGRRVLRFSSYQVRHEGAEVASVLARAFALGVSSDIPAVGATAMSDATRDGG